MKPDNTTTASNELSPAAILRWHLDAGVDETIGEAAENRFGLAPRADPQAASHPERMPHPERMDVLPAVVTPPAGGFRDAPAPTPSTPAPLAPPPTPKPPPVVRAAPPSPGQDQAVRSAVELSAEAQNLDQLREALGVFDGCALKKTASNLVFGDGNPDARLVLIGEAPGADEDRQGVPFVGASGKLLDRMLASIGLDRGDVFISNTVFWRPPGNRTPNAGEIAMCMPFVERLIELVDPQVLVTVGGPATHALLTQHGSVSRLRGRWFSYETPRMSRPVPATAIYHPAYLLRSPAMKRPTWHDLCLIREKLAEFGEK